MGVAPFAGPRGCATAGNTWTTSVRGTGSKSGRKGLATRGSSGKTSARGGAGTPGAVERLVLRPHIYAGFHIGGVGKPGKSLPPKGQFSPLN